MSVLLVTSALTCSLYLAVFATVHNRLKRRGGSTLGQRHVPPPLRFKSYSWKNFQAILKCQYFHFNANFHFYY